MTTYRDNSFVTKYSPQKLSDVVFSDNDVERAIHRYISGDDLRPLILYGPNGTGKSTLARLLPAEITPNPDIIQLDPLLAATERRLGKFIRQRAMYRGLLDGMRVYLLEEFDLFPKSLVKTIKSAIDLSMGEFLFIATTNDLNAIDKGHRSRSVRLHIFQAPFVRWKPRVKAILDAEGVSMPDDLVLEKMLENSGGDNRQFLADLQRYVEEVKAMETETI